MTRMVRKQIYIPKRQEVLLKKQARRRKASEAELIREAIEHAIQGNVSPRPFRRDPEAWDRIERFMLARRAQTTTAKPYHWKREDAYGDRMNRLDPKTK